MDSPLFGSFWFETGTAFEMTISSPPEVVTPIPDLTIDEDVAILGVDISSAFSDPDGDNLVFGDNGQITAAVVDDRGAGGTLNEWGLTITGNTPPVARDCIVDVLMFW